MLAVLFSINILSAISNVHFHNSVTVRGSKLIAIGKSIYNSSTFANVNVFELKESTQVGIINSMKTFHFDRIERSYDFFMLDIPDYLQKGKNKVWVKFKRSQVSHGPTVSPFMDWVGYINLDDMTLEHDPDFIKFPTHENFPVINYTINTITNKFGSALYITGGEIYSKMDKKTIECNSFFKYNFTTKEWVDMTYSASKKLKPLFHHNSLVIDDRYLVVLGGKRRTVYYSIPGIYDHNMPLFEYNSLYNLTIFDTFTNSWENINIKADVFTKNVSTLHLYGLFATVYKGKIIVFGGGASENRSNVYSENQFMGIFDLKSKNWVWFPITNEDGINYESTRSPGEIVLFNDQIIICNSKLNFIFSYFY